MNINSPSARLVVPCVLSILFVVVANASAANPIQVENAKAGTSDWRLSQGARNHEIEGYANLTSVNRGGQIQFFVNTIDGNFTIEFFRTGWYGGAGGRRMTSALQLAGTAQPSCSNDMTTGLIECDWINPYTLQIPNDTSDPTNWCSGVYLAKLTSASGLQSHIIFVVRDDSRPSDYLFQTSVNTYQAYNNWGGRSLYSSNSDFQARKVSFNRPYSASFGSGQYLDLEYPGVRFLEREGYDVTYATDVDVHEKANLLLSHKAHLVVGHGEYWTWEMRTNVVAARDQGVSIGIFAANTCYWQVRYEPSVSDGVANRTMVGYKERALTEDPYYINGDTSKYHLVTTYWRAVPVNLPEDAFIGVMYGHSGFGRADMVVYDASSWVFANTGLQNGSHLPQMLGIEVDNLHGNAPPGTTLLAHSPFQLSGQTLYADMTAYTATSGATVFAAGTIIWSWGLDDYKGGPVSPAVQQITRNILARFAGGASPVPLGSISVTPASVTAGGSATGTVTLSATAPSGGASVSLTSSNTSAAQVPASVTVAAGSTSATFTVTTSSVSSTTTVTLTGSYNGTKTTTLTVNPSGGGGGGSIAFVQQKAVSYSLVSSVVVTLNSAPRLGSALVLYSANSNVSVTGVSGGGVTWVRGASSGSHSVIHIWYGLNSSGSGTAITVTYASAAGSGGINVSEFSGVATANALDVAPAGTTGVSTTPTTPTAVTTNANDLLLAGAADQSVAATTAGPTNSFIALTEAANGNKVIPAYRIVSVTGSYNTSWTEASAGWDAVIVALKGRSLPSVSSVTVSPTSVTGGSSATGTVTLSEAAPIGGATVTLTSSNTSAVQVPASVTVPAGATGATFTVTTSAVTNVTSGTITGSYNGTTKTATLTVNPSASVSLTVTSIQPNIVSRNAGVVNFTITGTGFAFGASVTLENGTGPAPRVNSVTWNSSTQLTANVEIRSGGPPRDRLWDVRVTNPDGSTDLRAALLRITP